MARLATLSMLLLALSATIMCAARFYALDRAPLGFYFDEAAVANHALCIQETGADSTFGTRLPMFFLSESSGIHSAPYVYTAAAWTAIFGRSVAALRALSATATTVTILTLFFFAQSLFGRRAAWATVAAAAISPWAFQFSRIAWDNPFYPMFLVAGVHLLWTAKEANRSMAAALLLALAMYTYSPARLVVPLVVAMIFSLRVRRKTMQVQIAVPFILVFGASLVTMVIGMMTGPVNDRAKYISLYAVYVEKGSVFALTQFLRQLLQHFSTDFLLLRGDGNLRHSTQHFGALSWFDAVSIIGGVAVFGVGMRRPQRSAVASSELDGLLFVALACFVALLPSPLTTEGVPHALRAIAAWPFLALIVGAAYARISERSAFLACIGATAGVAFVVKFLFVFFLLYPSESADWFDTPEQKRLDALDRTALIADANTMRGKQPHARFYAMSREGVPCQELGVTRGPDSSPPGALSPLVLQLSISCLTILLARWWVARGIMR